MLGSEPMPIDRNGRPVTVGTRGVEASGEEDGYGPIRWAGRARGDVYRRGGGTIGQAPDVEGCGDERSSSRRSDPKYSGPSAPLLGGRYAEGVAPRDSRAGG